MQINLDIFNRVVANAKTYRDVFMLTGHYNIETIQVFHEKGKNFPIWYVTIEASNGLIYQENIIKVKQHYEDSLCCKHTSLKKAIFQAVYNFINQRVK